MATISEIASAFYEYSFNKFEEEYKNSTKPENKNFPTEGVFIEQFQSKISSIYNELRAKYTPDQTSYIYKNLIANLNRQAQHVSESKIVNFSTGTINVQNFNSYSKRVEETLKQRHPEKFADINENLQDESKQNQDSKQVDFNDPVQKEKYFSELFTEYGKLKTEEEKEAWKDKNFDNYSEYKESIDIYCRYREEYLKIKDEYPEIENEKCAKQASEKILKETGKSEDEILVDYEIAELSNEITVLEKQRNNIEEKSQEFQKLQKLIDEKYNRRHQLKKMKEENIEYLKKNEDLSLDIDNILEDVREDQETLDIDNIFNGVEEEQELLENDSILNDIQNEQDSLDISDILGDIENEQEIPSGDDNLNEIENVEQKNDNQYNSILGIAGKEALNVEELQINESQSQEMGLIEYKPNKLRNFFKSIINNIKESNLFKKIRNKDNENLNSEQKIDEMKEAKSSFDQSLIVSKEVQERNKQANEKNKISSINKPKENISISIGGIE